MNFENKLNYLKDVFGTLKAGNDISSAGPLLEHALLMLSGLKTEPEIGRYVDRLSFIQQDFEEFKCTKQSNRQQLGKIYDRIMQKSDEAKTAKLLFNYFWHTKPNRYDSNFLLADVIDAQLYEDKDIGVGSCLGLTQMDALIGLRCGLDISIQVSDEHIYYVVKDGNRNIHVENTDRFGFNSGFDKKSADFSLCYIIPVVCHNCGIRNHANGDFKRAADDYSLVIELCPNASTPYFNRGTVRYKLGDSEGGKEDFDKAAELNPNINYKNKVD
ncbi:MAG: hypothetical protein U9P44_00070 [archaeon]|nr:hypothetical protein [archaeon]